MRQQAHDQQLVHRVGEGVMYLEIVRAAQKPPQRGLHPAAALQPSRRIAVRVRGDGRVKLAVGGRPHNVAPIIRPQLRQVAPVKIRVVGKDRVRAIPRHKGAQILERVPPRTDALRKRQRAVLGALEYMGEHAAGLIGGRDDIVPGVHGVERLLVGHHDPDGHDLIGISCLRVDHGEHGGFLPSQILNKI